VPWLWSLVSTYPGKYAFLTAACPLLDVGDPVNSAAARALPPLVCTVEPYGPANQICAPPSYPNQTTVNCKIINMTLKPFLKGLARLSPTGPGPGPPTICSCSSGNLPLLARLNGTKAVDITETQNMACAYMHRLSGPHNLRPRMLQRIVSCLPQCDSHILLIKGLQVSRFAIDPQSTKLTFPVITSHSTLKSAPATLLENHREKEIKQEPATAHRHLEQFCGSRSSGQEETYTMSDTGGKRPGHIKPRSKLCGGWPCLASQLKNASFRILCTFPFQCISFTKQPCGPDDEREQFRGRTSVKGESGMGYVIFSDYIHASFLLFAPILSDCVNAAQFSTSSVEAMPSRSFNWNFLELCFSRRSLQSEIALLSISKDFQVSQHLLKDGNMKTDPSPNGTAAVFALKLLILSPLSCKNHSIRTSLLESTESRNDQNLRMFLNSTWSLSRVSSKFCISEENKLFPSAFRLTTIIFARSTIWKVNLWLQKLWKHDSHLLPQGRSISKWLPVGVCSVQHAPPSVTFFSFVLHFSSMLWLVSPRRPRI
jgi:hypothetical protein